jgi:hypothetical protein
VLNDKILDLTYQLLNSGGSLSDGESIDNWSGDQGSANDRRRVSDNWCRIRNWRQYSNSLSFRGIWNWCRWSLDWSWRLDWHQIGEHDLQHLLNLETGDLSPSSVQMDVPSGLENVLSNFSLCVQH